MTTIRFENSAANGCSGKVFLVGAGPGDPELISVKGLRLLQKADVVLYDGLVAPELLQETQGSAERIYVGKDPNSNANCSQETINQLLVYHAHLGKQVVRLRSRLSWYREDPSL